MATISPPDLWSVRSSHPIPAYVAHGIPPEPPSNSTFLHIHNGNKLRLPLATHSICCIVLSSLNTRIGKCFDLIFFIADIKSSHMMLYSVCHVYFGLLDWFPCFRSISNESLQGSAILPCMYCVESSYDVLHCKVVELNACQVPPSYA